MSKHFWVLYSITDLTRFKDCTWLSTGNRAKGQSLSALLSLYPDHDDVLYSVV